MESRVGLGPGPRACLRSTSRNGEQMGYRWGQRPCGARWTPLGALATNHAASTAYLVHCRA
eukprot:5504825-Prymnesium_polylepis.1